MVPRMRSVKFHPLAASTNPSTSSSSFFLSFFVSSNDTSPRARNSKCCKGGYFGAGTRGPLFAGFFHGKRNEWGHKDVESWIINFVLDIYHFAENWEIQECAALGFAFVDLGQAKINW